MINKVRAWESQILRHTFRHSRVLDETTAGFKIKTSRFMRLCWQKTGLPLTEKIENKIWTTMTWAVYDGDVSVLLAMRSLLGWRTRLHGGEVDRHGAWRGTRTVFKDGSTKLG